MIRRRFVDVAGGQIHCRVAGEEHGGVPLVMLYAAPYSSKMLEPMIEAVGRTRWAIGMDPPGQGDSSPPTVETPDISYFSETLISAMTAIGVNRFDVYGEHTGNHIASRAAADHPDRIRAIILVSAGIETDWDFRDEYVDHVSEVVEPDTWGTQFSQLHGITRDLYLFWPYYRHGPENVRRKGLPDPAILHERTVELAKSYRTYKAAYLAALRNDLPALYPDVVAETLLITHPDDPNVVAQGEVAALLANATLGDIIDWAPEAVGTSVADWLATLD